MKGKSVVKISEPLGADDLESQLSGEVQMVLKSMIANYAADELFANLQIQLTVSIVDCVQ